MPHKSSHKRGASVQQLAKRNAAIKEIMDSGGYTKEQATLIHDGGSLVTTIDGDNAETAVITKEVIPGTENPRGYGGQTRTIQTDKAGNVYDKEGNLLRKAQPTEETESGGGLSLSDVRANANARRARYGQRKQGGVLRYPLEAMTESTDYLQIDIEKYVPIGNNYVSAPGGDSRYVTGNRFTNRAGRTSTTRLSTKPLINAGTILLPIPANLQDSNNVVYGESKLNGLAAAGVSAVEGIVENVDVFDLEKTKQAIQEQGSSFRTKVQEGVGDFAGATDALNKKLAAEAVNIFGANVTFNQLLARGNGEILNPNMELLFSDVTIRNFRFSFKLAPRNPKEAEQVKLIIRAFKRNMAPQAQGGTLQGGSFFLNTPNIFKLRYRSGVKDHPFLNKFKQCFLSDMQTTYTGEGVYATYDDGTPVSMQLDLSFKERQPIYDIDYDEGPGTGAVGY